MNACYRSLKEYFDHRYGERVQKIPLSTGFSCPNRDGTISRLGCSFCRPEAFSPFNCSPDTPLMEQLTAGIAYFGPRYRARRFLPFLQTVSGPQRSGSGTAELCEQLLAIPGVIGLSIAVRPDDISPTILAPLSEISRRCFIGIELGIESCSNEALLRARRGHTFEQAAAAVELCAQHGLFVTGHVMFGLPGEGNFPPSRTAEYISNLPLQAVKLHHLQILRETAFAQEFAEHPQEFPHFSFDEYLDLLVDFLEHLDPRLFIDRLTARAPRRLLLSPRWDFAGTNDPGQALRARMRDKQTFQGRTAKLPLRNLPVRGMIGPHF